MGENTGTKVRTGALLLSSNEVENEHDDDHEHDWGGREESILLNDQIEVPGGITKHQHHDGTS